MCSEGAASRLQYLAIALAYIGEQVWSSTLSAETTAAGSQVDLNTLRTASADFDLFC